MGNRSTVKSETKTVFASGQTVTISGVYSVHHFSEHSRDEMVIARRNDEVPLCPQCGASLVFELVRVVPSVSEDPDFKHDSSGGNKNHHK